MHLCELGNVIVAPGLDNVFSRLPRFLTRIEGGYRSSLLETSSSGSSYHYAMDMARAVDARLEHGMIGERVTTAIIE